jgi:hypothetical protein
MNFAHERGASMAAQWYWPPDVGAMDTSSESVVKTEMLPSHTMM